MKFFRAEGRLLEARRLLVVLRRLAEALRVVLPQALFQLFFFQLLRALDFFAEARAFLLLQRFEDDFFEVLLAVFFHFFFQFLRFFDACLVVRVVR